MLIISLILVLLLTGADQLIKYFVVLNYAQCNFPKAYYTFSIGSFKIFSLTHIRNDGAGWSILSGKTVILIVFTAIVMIGILAYMIVKRKDISKLELFSLTLILSGGLGNLIDRIRMLTEADFSGVIDYINLEFMSFPVFNFADICVTVGGACFILCYIILEIKEAKQKRAKKLADESDSNADSKAD